MLHALYIIAFSALAILAVSNLIRNMLLLGNQTRSSSRSTAGNGPARRSVPHPEMLDDRGRVVDEPLLVMRSISLEDARERLDALYDDSTNSSDAPREDD